MTGIITRFRDCLPLSSDAPSLSLGEGGTPLLPLLRVPEGFEIYVKVEGANPTGSFKDRGMVVATADAVSRGVRYLICASTGNTSASAAAYSAHAGLPCVVLIPKGKVAAGKIAQAVAHGAHIVQIDGNFDDAMSAVKLFSDEGEAAVVNSINPYRLQGQKTAALEVVESFTPDYHALPVGNAGNITAHWIGYCEAAGEGTKACSFCGGKCDYCTESKTKSRPKMLGYQAEKSAPFITGAPVVNPETVATAIRIGNPQSYEAAKTVVAESGGWIHALSDNDILSMQRHLASREGVFCEPASAASVAGVFADIAAGKLKPPARIVCTLTGHGLKDPDIVGEPKVKVASADTDSMRRTVESIVKEMSAQ